MSRLSLLSKISEVSNIFFLQVHILTSKNEQTVNIIFNFVRQLTNYIITYFAQILNILLA